MADPDCIPALGYRWQTPLYDVAIRAATSERRFKQALIREAGMTLYLGKARNPLKRADEDIQ